MCVHMHACVRLFPCVVLCCYLLFFVRKIQCFTAGSFHWDSTLRSRPDSETKLRCHHPQESDLVVA